jgi:SAM-dependent methyltransferase
MPAGIDKTAASAGISEVDASAHFERLKHEVRQVEAARERPRPVDDPRAEAEVRWSVAVDRPIVRRPGLRGALVHPVKKVLRKLMSWYVGPFAAEQRDFNAALLRVADRLSAENDELRAELAREEAARRSGQDELGAAFEGTIELERAARASLETTVSERRRLLSEIEERLLRVERRKEGAPATVAAQPGAASVPDYFAFESRMRGQAAEIRERQRPYVEDFHSGGPVLDLGCGRGEFVALLGEAGIDARGVDADADMVAFARGEGLDVDQADAVAALDEVEDGTLGGVFAAQLLEHLPPGAIVRLLELAARKLRPGGVLIAETINPLSPLALRNYFADLTHAQPLVPETLELLVRQAGFAEVEKRFLNEPEERLTVPDDPVLARNVRRLNELLFAPLDYAIVARR